MTDDQMITLAVVAGGLTMAVIVTPWFLVSRVLGESRAWRHLVQLYYEARLHKSLPVDAPTDDEPVSSLTIPKDIQEELARQDAERGEWL